MPIRKQRYLALNPFHSTNLKDIIMKFHKTYRLPTALTFFAVIVAFNVYAGGHPWDDHNHPFNFIFGNHFDTHQQSKVNGGKDKLVGFFYIRYVGGSTDGLSNAQHGTETVGWVLDGLPAYEAEVIDTSGLHPVWCLDPEDIPRPPGYTHFHWIGDPESGSDLEVEDVKDGYLLKLTAIDSFFFEHGDFPITPGIDYVSHNNIVIDENGDGCADY